MKGGYGMLLESIIVANGIHQMIKADKNNAQAAKINTKAFTRIATADAKITSLEQLTEKSILRLANRKKGILQTSIKSFLEVYDKIIKINFQPGDGIKELENLSLSPSQVGELKKLSQGASLSLTDAQILTSFLISGIPGLIVKESEYNVSLAQIRNKQSLIIESQAETICTYLESIASHANMISDLLTKLNVLFIKVLNTTQSIIEINGFNRSNYSTQDKESLMTCINFASALKNILDAKLLDGQSEISKEAIECIENSNKFLQQINQLIGGN